MSWMIWAPWPLTPQNRRGVTKTCTVLAQFDVMCMLADGLERPDIAAGINLAMAERISKMAKKVKVRPEVTMTGGVAKNPGVVQALEKVFGLANRTSGKKLTRRSSEPWGRLFLPRNGLNVWEPNPNRKKCRQHDSE